VIPTIETPRLLLRGFREADLDAYADMMARPEVTRFLGTGETLDRENAWRQIAMILGHWTLRGFGFWAVEERASGRFLGRIGPWQPEGWPGLEVGWTLAPHAWGHGYATEGGRAALAYAFRTLGADRVISLIARENVASIRVAERLGETFERTVPMFGQEVQLYAIDRARFASS
jgi:RimJ/RimL family protein N-acetyltransferase